MRQTQKNPSVLAYGLLILVLWLALGLRLYRIQVPSLWNDEGTSVALASRDLAAITRGAANDIHPPLYYYLLHFWMKAFGNSELAVRALSALLGTLLVLLTFAFAHAVAGYRVGLIAALFAAFSPFQVYYSQETRMYALSALLAALSMYILWHLLARWQDRLPASRLLAVAYTMATILLLYSHYFTVTIVLAQNLAFAWWWLRETRSTPMRERWWMAWRWLVLQGLIGISYLPWLLLSGQQLRNWPAISAPVRLTTLAADLLRVFSLGLSGETLPRWILVGFAGLLLLGLVTLGLIPGGKKRVPRGGWGSVGRVMSLLYLLLPIAIMFVLSLQRPMYNPKFLLLCTPAFYLFLAQGAVSLSTSSGYGQRQGEVEGPTRGNGMARFLGWLPAAFLVAAVIFVVGASALALQAYYLDPRYARDDYRGIAQYIQAIEREGPEGGDAILINAPGQIETFAYYYHGKLPLCPLPRQRPLNEAETQTDLQELTLGRGRVFAVLWATDESDPGRFIEGWLDQHTYKAMDSWYGNVRLVVYAVPVEPPGGGTLGPSLEDIQHPVQVKLGNQIRFLGYNLPAAELMPGDILQLTLFWQAVGPIEKRYKVFTHVLDGAGHLVGQRDAEPGGGARITTVWKEEELVADNYGLPILPATPPGECTIEIGMYSLDDGARLPVSPVGTNGEAGQATGDRILLQTVRVLPAAAPPPLSVLAITERRDARFGEITLLGYNLTKLGLEHEPDAPIHPGDILHLTLFWQASQKPVADIALQLQLRDEKGAVRLELQTTPTEGLYPVSDWREGEIVRDQHNWALPADLQPARYHLYLSGRASPGGQPTSVPSRLGSVLIR